MAFPAGPYTNGQTHTEAGVTYTYNSTIGGWHKPAAAGLVAPTTTITGINSVTGGGDFSVNRTYELVNDAVAPAIWSYYGTDAAGVKGWQRSRRVPPFISVAATAGSVIAANGTSTSIWSNLGAGGGVYTFATNGVTIPANRLHRVTFSIATANPGTNVFIVDANSGGAIAGGLTDDAGNYYGTWLGKPATAYRIALRAGSVSALTINYARIYFTAVD